MTSPREERKALRRWQPRDPQRDGPPFAALVAHEFLPPEQHAALLDRMVRGVADYALAQVPYYRDRRAAWGLAQQSIRGVADLAALPVLSKFDVQEHFESLRTTQLPPGERLWGVATSSGTTGRPTQVITTARTSWMFALMIHRLLRWARWDPNLPLASLRVAITLPKGPDGKAATDGVSFAHAAWPHVGAHFHTGPALFLTRTTPLDAQIAWLRRERPGYLITYPATLETLAYACQGRPTDSLQGARAISVQLTEGARARIESAFGFPIHQNYGLNELGVVANRCEAGRYHVCTEHCVVEIVDDHGRPCAPGERGRIVVTALTNLAMPLLRYDTTDEATMPNGPCACGRTQPGFEDLLGRHRDLRHTPPGTAKRLNLVLETIAELPLSLLRDLTQVRLHQSRDEVYTLRLETRAPLPEGVTRAVDDAWRAEFPESPLMILEVDRMPECRGGKPQVFVSDFLESDNPHSGAGG